MNTQNHIQHPKVHGAFNLDVDMFLHEYKNALEEGFGSWGSWTADGNGVITYVAEEMQISNPSSSKKNIGTSKTFTTGEGLHSVSFKVIGNMCSNIVIWPPSSTPIPIQVFVKDNANNIVASGNYTVAGSYNLSFTPASASLTYRIEFYMANASAFCFFRVDDVLVSYEDESVVTVCKEVENSYLYGFQGQLRDDEVSGKGNHYTAQFWEFDPRIGRRWNLDPVVKPWESGYATFANNPISYSDPLGLDVVNAHKADKEKAESKLGSAKEKLGALNKEDQGYKKAKKELKQAESAFNNINAKFQRVESKIKEIKGKDIDLFNAADKLTDAGGTKVDIYVYDTPADEMQENVGEGMVKFGSTDAQPGPQVSSYDGSKPDYTAVMSKRHGDNTITIRISDVAETLHLAHEFGHAIYQAKNMKEYLEWLQAHPTQQNKGGHGKGDPSGKAAHEAEKKFK